MTQRQLLGMDLCKIEKEEKNIIPASNEVYTKLGRLLVENDSLKKNCDELQSRRVMNEDRIRYLEDCQDTLENRAASAESHSRELENRWSTLKHQFEAKCLELETLKERLREKAQQELSHAQEKVSTVKENQKQVLQLQTDRENDEKPKEEVEKKLSLLIEELTFIKEQNRIMETQLLEKQKFITAEEHPKEELKEPLWNENIVIKTEPPDTSMSDSEEDDDGMNEDVSCEEKNMHKKKRSKYRQRSYKKMKNSHGTSPLQINSFRLHPITINIDDSDSSDNEPDKLSENLVKSPIHPREKFIKAISTMRMLDLNGFGLQEVKFAEDSLYRTMKDLAKKGDGDFLNEIILNYILSRQTEVSLKAEKQNTFACSEKCVAACCKKLIRIGQAKIITDLMLSFYNIVKNQSRYTLFGYASGVMLFSAVSKSVSEHKNIRTLCSEIVVSHKNISHYLLALIYQVYPNAVYQADAKNNWKWFQAVIELVFSEKPKDMPIDEWQDICAVYENVPKLADLAYESPEQLLEMMMTDIENYSDSSYETISRHFGFAMLMLGVHCGKEWAESVLIKHFSLYKETHSENLVKNIFTMFASIEGRLKSLLK